MSKWTKERPHTNPGFTKVDLEAKVEIDNRLFRPITDSSVGIGIETGETTTTIEIIIGPTIGISLETTIDVTVGETTTGLMKDKLITGKTIETDNIIKGMTPNRGIGIGVRV